MRRTSASSALAMMLLIGCGVGQSFIRNSVQSSEISLGGTISGLAGYGEILLYNNEGDEYFADTNGSFTFPTGMSKGDSYNVSVDFSAHYVDCVVTNASGTVGSSNITNIDIACTRGNFTNAQAAVSVIGQDDFESSGNDHLDTPFGNAVYAKGYLFFPDTGHNRILIYEGIATGAGAQPIAVIGQASMEDTGALATSASSFVNPANLSSDAAMFAVTEIANSRILIYNNLPSREGGRIDADIVIGQNGDFTTSVNGTGADHLKYPQAAFVGAGRLIVADTGNNRVLLWNTVPTSSDDLPDLVLGQLNFDDNSSGTSASTLNFPTGVWTDGTRILVAEYFNNRILLWNSWPTENGAPAEVVLGQENMNSSGSGLNASHFNFSQIQVTSDGTRIYAADTEANRVLVWNSFPTVNGVAADRVLGQGDFVSDGYGTSETSLWAPSGVTVAGKHLIVSDQYNNRLVVYDAE